MIEAALTKAIAKCGRPRSILVDNGKVYSSKTLMMACSVLGIQKIHSRPYHPQSKGKQERLFRTLRSQLLNEVENLEPISLDRLNSLLHAWAEQYHLQEHSEFQDRETPASRYAGVQIDNVPRELLEEAFLQWTQRRVSKQGVIEFSGNKYWADASLAGSNVVVRYNPFDLSRIYIWRDGIKLGVATPEQLLHKILSRPPRPSRERSLASERYLDSIEKNHWRRVQQSTNQIQFPEDSNHD